MRANRLSCLLLAAALAVSLAGCAGQDETPEASPSDSPARETEVSPSPGTQAVFSLPVFLNASLHPVQCGNRANLALLPLMYEGLFELDTAFEPKPVLCRTWQVDESGLTWTFTLHSGVTFSDGTPLTASQVVSSLQAAAAAGTRFANRLSQIQSVSAAGEDTVTVTLRTPNGALPALLDVPVYLERDGVCYGTGPYVLDESGAAPVLRGRSDWHGGTALPSDEIRLTPVEQTEDLIHAFDTRDASLVLTDLTGSAALGYSTTGNEVWDYPTSDMVYLIFHTASGSCASQTLRQALARGVDRTSLVNFAFSRRVTAAALPVSPASALYDQDLAAAQEYDLTAMTDLLDSVRVKGPLRLLVNSENSFKTAAADFLAEQWQGVGLEVSVEKLAWDDYLAALARGDFDLCLAEISLTADFDLTSLVGTGGSLNYGGWHSAETDSLLSVLRAARGDEARKQAASALYAHLAEKCVLVPLCFKNYSVLTRWGSITGLTPTQSNPFFGMLWSLT